jgi:hypothetical protein
MRELISSAELGLTKLSMFAAMAVVTALAHAAIQARAIIKGEADDDANTDDFVYESDIRDAFIKRPPARPAGKAVVE